MVAVVTLIVEGSLLIRVSVSQVDASAQSTVLRSQSPLLVAGRSGPTGPLEKSIPCFAISAHWTPLTGATRGINNVCFFASTRKSNSTVRTSLMSDHLLHQQMLKRETPTA